MKLPIDPSEKGLDDPNYLLQYSQYTTAGTEVIDGNLCRIMQFVNNGTTTKIWIWEEKNLPMRIQTSSQGTVSIFDYKGYVFMPIPDSEFALPANVTIRP